MKSVQIARPNLAVPSFDTAARRNQYRLRTAINYARANHCDEQWETVQSVGIHAVAARLRKQFRAAPGTVMLEAFVQQRALKCLEQLGLGNSHRGCDLTPRLYVRAGLLTSSCVD